MRSVRPTGRPRACWRSRRRSALLPCSIRRSRCVTGSPRQSRPEPCASSSAPGPATGTCSRWCRSSGRPRRPVTRCVVTTGRDLAALLERCGSPRTRPGLTLAESYQQMPGDVLDQRAATGGAADLRRAAPLRCRCGATAPATCSTSSVTWRPDLVVHDTLELGSPTAAVRTGIPHVTHGYGPTVPRTDRVRGRHRLDDRGCRTSRPDTRRARRSVPRHLPAERSGPEPHPWPTTIPAAPVGRGVTTATDLGRLGRAAHRDTVYVTLGTIMNQAPGRLPRRPRGLLAAAGQPAADDRPGVDPGRSVHCRPSVRMAPFLPQAACCPSARP